jgi:2-oxoglutarate ferredoxin oxidoreductase subunit alpha
MHEAIAALEAKGIHLDLLRVRAFPFSDAVIDFVLEHDQVFVVEQNRDAQLRALLINEGAIDPARIISVLHYDGTPITARFIVDEIARRWGVLTGKPKSREAAE